MLKRVIGVALCVAMLMAMGSMAVATERSQRENNEVNDFYITDDRIIGVTDRAVLDAFQEANNLVAPLGTSNIVAIIYAPSWVDEVSIDMQTGEINIMYNDEAQEVSLFVPEERHFHAITPSNTAFGSFVIRNPVARPAMSYHYPDTIRHNTLSNHSSHTTSLSHTLTLSRTGALSASVSLTASTVSAAVGFNHSHTFTESTTVTVNNVPPRGSVVVESSLWAHVVDFRIYESVPMLGAHIFAGMGATSRPSGVRAVVWG